MSSDPRASSARFGSASTAAASDKLQASGTAPGIVAAVTGVVWASAGSGAALVVLAIGAAGVIGFHVVHLRRIGDWAAGAQDVDMYHFTLAAGDVLWVRAGQVHQWGEIADLEGAVAMFSGLGFRPEGLLTRSEER